MRILSIADKWFARCLSAITALLTAAILVIVNIQVFGRYFFKFSLGGLSDLPPYLMIFTIWFGAILAARSEDHIKIEVLDLIVKNKTVRAVVNILLDLITTLVLAYFTYYAILYVRESMLYGSREPALKIPYWYLYTIIPFGGGFMSLYYLVSTVKGIVRIRKGEA